MPLRFTFKKLPVDESGKAFDSLEAFQSAQIEKLLPPINSPPHVYAEAIVKQKALVKEILDLTMDARPGARGVKKTRKPKTDQPDFGKAA